VMKHNSIDITITRSYFRSAGDLHRTVTASSMNVWSGQIGYLLIRLFVSEDLTAANYLNFLTNELPLLMKDVSLDTSLSAW
jgi:hypothetical protein